MGLVPQVELLGTVPIDLKTCELKKELGCNIHMEHILMGQVYSNCYRPFSSKSGKMGSMQESTPILKSRRVHVAIYLSGLQYYCLAMVHHGSWLCPLSLISFSIKNGLCDNWMVFSVCFLHVKCWLNHSFHLSWYSFLKTLWVSYESIHYEYMPLDKGYTHQSGQISPSLPWTCCETSNE